MAARIVRHVPGTGSVSMAKIRKAVKAVKAAKNASVKRKASTKRLVITNGQTASGRKVIAFYVPKSSTR